MAREITDIAESNLKINHRTYHPDTKLFKNRDTGESFLILVLSWKARAPEILVNVSCTLYKQQRTKQLTKQV